MALGCFNPEIKGHNFEAQSPSSRAMRTLFIHREGFTDDTNTVGPGILMEYFLIHAKCAKISSSFHFICP